MRYLLAAAVAALTLSVTPALAAGSSEPVKLTDEELDQVTAGASLIVNAPIDVLLKNISIQISLQNAPVNLGLAVQLNVLGTAAQTASITAVQTVTQLAP
jgi:hypothetical protein